MDIVSLIISLISGAVGGNIAGALMKNNSLGTLGNSIAGIVGGGLGTWVLQAIGVFGGAGGATSIGTIIGEIASGGVGGGILMAIIGLIRGAMAQK